MPAHTIPLTKPIEGHKGLITEIVLREPSFDDYIDCGGEPYTVGQSPEGVLFPVENFEIIKAYIERLVVEPQDRVLLAQASFRDARAVRSKVLGFFQEAAAASAASATSQTTSP